MLPHRISPRVSNARRGPDVICRKIHPVLGTTVTLVGVKPRKHVPPAAGLCWEDCLHGMVLLALGMVVGGRIMRDYLCSRELLVDGSDKDRVTVYVGKPERKSEREFACPFQLVGVGEPILNYGRGVDCLQALTMALEGIRVALENTGRTYSWAGGETGDHGFRQLVPSFYGLGFSKHIERIIENEIRLFAENAIPKP
jgi:hypothetical protein